MRHLSEKRKGIVSRLIEKAVQKSGNPISPCGKCHTLRGSITALKDEMVLWYNTPDGSTHIVKEKINN